LELVKLPVNPSQREQLLVRSHFPQAGFVHHKDSVGSLYRREAMRDHEDVRPSTNLPN